MNVLGDSGVLPAPRLDARDPERPDHLLDVLVPAAGRRREPEHASPLRSLGPEPFGDGDVDVLADGVVGLVKDDESNGPEVVSAGGEVVLHDLGGGEDEVGVGPAPFPDRAMHRTRESGHSEGNEPLPKGVGVLLDQRSCRREHEDLPVLTPEDLRGDQARDDGLPESRGKDHEQVLLDSDPGELDLERQSPDHARPQEWMLDHSLRHAPDPRVRVRVGANPR